MTVGILIVAHAPLASAMRHCLEHIYGYLPEKVEAIDVGPNINEEECSRWIRYYVSQVCGKNGTLILCDLANATPSNIVTTLENSLLIKIVCGVNLPLLLKAISYRTLPLSELVDRVISGGMDGINLLEAQGNLPPSC